MNPERYGGAGSPVCASAEQAYKQRSHCEYMVESIATVGCALAAILAQIDQIVGPDVEALGLQSI
jgi:hypothetical protein